MSFEIINVLSNNKIEKFDLLDNLDDYIKLKQQDYLYELSENNFKILPWRKLELITAVKNKALMYEDVPEYIKERHLLPSRDEGIDVVKIEEGEITKVFQCKCYTSKTVCKSDLKSFYQFQQLKYKLNSASFIVVGSLATKINKSITQVKYDINEYINIDAGNKNEVEIDNKLKLRKYQVEAIDKIRQGYNIKRNINIKIPCGCGKTMLMYHFGVNTQYKILIMVPKISIAEQIKETFEKRFNKEINCYWTHHKYNKESNVTLCVYNSVEDIIKNEYDMLFIDEAHHIIGYEKYKKNCRFLDIDENLSDEELNYMTLIQNIDTKTTINLSATIDVKSEDDYEYKFDEAISEGYLTDYEINILYVDSLFNNGDKNNYNQIATVINENKEYKHIIIYCNRIETAEKCNLVLNNNEIISYVLTSNMSLNQREQRLKDFRNGLVRVICSVNCLNEGTDLPIADTCMFLNDRYGEINIIQCVGRILRLHKFKNKARIILFDVNSLEANVKGDYYLRALCKYDNFFKEKLQRRIKIYDHTSTKRVNIQLKRSEYFDKITKFRLTWDQKIKLCREYVEEFGNKWPTRNFVYKNWYIGRYISDLKFTKLEKKKSIIQSIFNNTLSISRQLTPDEWIKLNTDFKQEHNRLPKSKEKYRGYDIGGFIHRIINQNQHKNLKKKMEEIYEQKLEPKHTKIVYTDEQKLELNQQFSNEFGRLPREDEVIGDFKIGRFINRLKQGQTPHLKERLEKIYGQKIEVTKQVKKYEDRDDETKFKLCEEFYNEYERFPKPSDNDLVDFNMYDFVMNSLNSKVKAKRERIISIFNITDEELNKPKNKRVTNSEEAIPYINAVMKYYHEHKTLPTNSRKPYTDENGFNITILYLEAKRPRGVGIYIRPVLEKEGYIFPSKENPHDFEIESLMPDQKLKFYDMALNEGCKITSTNKWYKYIKNDVEYGVDLYDFKYDIKNKKASYAEEYLPKILEIEKKHEIPTVINPRFSKEEQYDGFKRFYIKYKRMPVAYGGKDYIEMNYKDTTIMYDIGARYKKIIKDTKFIEKNREFVKKIENIPNEFNE